MTVALKGKSQRELHDLGLLVENGDAEVRVGADVQLPGSLA